MSDLLLSVIGLVFVIEGLLPAVSPGSYVKLVAAISKMSESNIRTFGLVMLVVGAVCISQGATW